MDIAIRGRNVAVSDILRSTVEEKVTRLGRYLDGLERAEVSFREERNPRIAEREVCEVTVVGRGRTVRAKAAAPDNLVAVDRVVDKLEHRLERMKGRLVRRSYRRRASALDMAVADGAAAEDSEDEPPIVRSRQFDTKPMTAEEAVLQMHLLGHDFFLFTSAETARAAVVYHRQDGLVGLIDAL
jgi:putative sigma-54 modulation protein